MVDPLLGGDAVVELGGDPRRPLGAVLGVDHADPIGQLPVRRCADSPNGDRRQQASNEDREISTIWQSRFTSKACR